MAATELMDDVDIATEVAAWMVSMMSFTKSLMENGSRSLR